MIIIGARTRDDLEPLVNDFQQFGLALHSSTDDGSYGTAGFVTDVLKSQQLPRGSEVYACGPEPMLAGIRQICLDRQFGCQVSIESVMACGMGACLGCNVSGSGGGYVHVCLDGPVFRTEDLLW